MILTILIVFISLIGLIVLHEFGHFILAKKFGVKVEEFGIGYPPRLFGKKIGETIYSLNLLPLGAFVRMPGEIEKKDEPGSFSQQSIGKRALIVLGGVISFWITAIILFSIVFSLGAPMAVGDEPIAGLIDPKIQIAGVASNSPAQIAGLRVGDVIKEMLALNEQLVPLKVKEIQDFINTYLEKEITLVVKRGEEVFQVSLVPRTSPPEGEGPMGIALIRTAIKKYPWYQAFWQGILETFNLTWAVIQGYFQVISNAFRRLPLGVQVMGPVGIFHLLTQIHQLGLNYFLNFLGLISIYLAIFNLLPIPAVDGGKLLFLGIEAVRGKPVSEKVEQKITVFFFGLLILLMIWVTFKDITRLF